MKTINLYQFGELSLDAQKRALEEYRNLRNQNWDESDNEQVEEAIRTVALEKYGVDPKLVMFSLGHCQGDGVAFYGRLNMDKLCKKHPSLIELVNECSVEGPIHIESDGANGRYHHWNSMSVFVVDENNQSLGTWEGLTEEARLKLQNAAEKLESAVKEILQAASRECESVGYEVMEDMLSEENLRDEMEANEVWFLASGKLFRD